MGCASYHLVRVASIFAHASSFPLAVFTSRRKIRSPDDGFEIKVPRVVFLEHDGNNSVESGNENHGFCTKQITLAAIYGCRSKLICVDWRLAGSFGLGN